MTKEQWQRHAREAELSTMSPVDRSRHFELCPECAKRRKTRKQNTAARSRNEAMRSLGLTKTPYGWE